MAWGLTRDMRRLSAVVAITIAGLVAVSSAEAMRVSPMVAELTTTGAGSTARIEVGNIGNAALPFETVITEVDMTGDVITEKPADEEFLVFPPQGLVPTNGRQVVRVQWVGAPDLDASRAFYLSVRQLPVEVTPSGEGGGSLQVSVLYTMKALLVVAPPNARPDVRVEKVVPAMVSPPAIEIDPALTGGEQVGPPPAEPGIEVTLVNQGKRYALLSGATWSVSGTDLSGQPYNKTLTGDTISQTVGVGYLAPSGGRRTFKIPTDGIELDPAKPLTVRFGR